MDIEKKNIYVIYNCIDEYFHKGHKKDITPIIKFITNNKLKTYETNYKWNEEEDEYQEIINNCDSFIEKLLINNNITLNEIYQKTIIKNKTKSATEEYIGFYVYICGQIEKELIQLYKFITGNIPIAQNILLCSKEISNEEITAFLYRAIYCEFHSCFVIGGIESLNFNQKNFFIELLNEILNERNGTLKSCLIILCNDRRADIFKSLNNIKYKKFFLSEIEDEISKQKLDTLNNIYIISSDKSGVGKSTKIFNIIKQKNKLYIHFPIGGTFTREDIIKRLKSLNIDKNSAIHLDLYDTDCIELLNEFLFWILIAGLYKVNEDIFYLLKETEIYVEIPNGFIDFYAKFPILTLFPQKQEFKLSINHLEPLIVSNKLDSNIQIVCNYLKIFKDTNKIDTVDLFIPNITQDSLKAIEIIDKTFYEAKIISQKECQELIINLFKKENRYPNISYYQITSLIEVLAVQLIKFNQSFHVNAAQLKQTNLLKHIRTYFIESFINLGIYFTEGAFTQLINNQNVNEGLSFGQYNENEAIENGVKSLADDKHNIISFDKMKHSLIFFHEGNKESFSIITNKNESDPEYNLFLVYKKTQRTKGEEIKKLTDYKDNNFKQEDFLRELKDILDIQNPVNKIEQKTSINKNLKCLDEIANDYVFTPDNFLKMVLILIRIRSNVPVIMMGETGCGKTALIRKLAELKDNGSYDKMKILNIHAGTTDNDIIKFINSIIPQARKLEEEETKIKKEKAKKKELYDEKKIWVFLDEINTCKSLGLISELMCKHSCQGLKLNSNIVFIAACNPYRKAYKKIENNGLKINLAYQNMKQLNDKEKGKLEKNYYLGGDQLIYKVYPLPNSLLNYVFDFGSLEKEDEKKYIEKIIESSIEKIFNECKEKLEKVKLDQIKKLARDMIIEAQNFIRDNHLFL